MDAPHIEIDKIVCGDDTYILTYQEADVSDGMTGYFLNLWKNKIGNPCTYAQVIKQSNSGKTPEEAVQLAINKINTWLKTNVKADTTTREKTWKEKVLILIKRIRFFLQGDVPQIR